jgi:hypothetical protein
MKKILFAISALLTCTAQPFQPNFDIDDMDTRTPPGDQSRMDTAKPKEQQEPGMPVRKPLRRPTHLTPMERSILDTFEYQLAPLADGLSSLTASPEARQAKEARLKEREQRAKEALKRRAPEDHRWWQPSDSSYRPSHRGGFSDFGGDGWRPPSSPRIPSYWTPPSSGFGEQEVGSPSSSYTPTSPSSSDSTNNAARRPGLTTRDGDGDDDDDNEKNDGGDEGSKKVKGPSGFVDKGDSKGVSKGLSEATTALSGIANRIEKLNLTGATSDKLAQTLIDQHIIQKLDKAVEKADDALASLSDENKKTLQAKCDELEKQQKRVEKLYAILLPHALRAATMLTHDANISKQQESIKTFIEGRIANEVPVALYNRLLGEREDELLNQIPAAGAVRAGGEAHATDAQCAYLQHVIDLMPTGLGDHPNAGRARLIQRHKEITDAAAAAEEKAAGAKVAKAADKAPVVKAPGAAAAPASVAAAVPVAAPRAPASAAAAGGR